MNFDEMMETWRTQDDVPLYGVNPELLRVVVRQEYAEARRESGWEGSFVPWALWMASGAMLVVVFALLFVATSRGWSTLIMWDHVATGIATGALLVWPALYWAIQRRQPSHERDDDSLQAEIRRSLSRIEHQLWQHERLAPSLLMRAPLIVVATLLFWIMLRMNDGAIQGRMIVFVVAIGMLFPLLWTGGYLKARLLAQKRRLNQLLELLNVSEGFPRRPD